MVLPPTLLHQWASMPLVARVLAVLLPVWYLLGSIVPHLLGALLSTNSRAAVEHVSHACLQPVLRWPQTFLELLFAPLCHAGLLHLVFNTWAAIVEVSALERGMGSVGAALTVALVWPATQLVTLAGSMAVYAGGSSHFSCVLGFSGVLFALLTIVCLGETPDATHSLFGCLTVPSRLVPVAMLAVTQLLFPGASFVGHTSGVLCGFAVVQFVPRLSLVDPLDLASAKFDAVLASWSEAARPAQRRSWRSASTPLGVPGMGGLSLGGNGHAGAPEENPGRHTSSVFVPPGVVEAPTASLSSFQAFTGPGRPLGSSSSTTTV